MKGLKDLNQELIEKAKSFDRKAQASLYEAYCKAMYNTSYRIIRDPFAAEDVMQDAFIEAFKKLDQFNQTSTFGAWLKRIVVNRAINYLKAENRNQKLIEEVALDSDSSIASVEDFSFSVQDIKKCVPQLARKYQLVFNLYLIEGYDHEEIGDILGISSATSRSQLSRAKRRVKEMLEQE